VPFSRTTLASTVGLPRESNTSAAVILLIRMFSSHYAAFSTTRSDSDCFIATYATRSATRIE
jgi:hypothetical protein